MENFQTNNIIYYEGNQRLTYEQDMVVEEPLAIMVEGEPYSVVMRTPGKEIPHAAGFCLAEGLVDDAGDFAAIGFCEDMDPNVVTVSLVQQRRKKVSDLLKRRSFISQSSCGICGKELIKDLNQILTPIDEKNNISKKDLIDRVNQLPENQPIYKRTKATHASMIFDSTFNLMATAEDVGRHNALDKAIGEVFMAGKMTVAKMAVLSSRISYEMVQKAARAKLEVVIGVSMPTSLAVNLGKSLNMTIASLRKNRLMIFCGEERIDG
jgi:FdhD protein